jgi:hypothetical protein
LGKRSDFPRRPHDDYQTIDPKALARLLPFLKRDGIESFAEPCIGEGHLATALTDLGFHCVLGSDIKGGIDALLLIDFNGADAIITNPPWTRAVLHPMIEHFLAHAPVTWLLFDSDWAHNVQAAPYLRYCSDIVAVGRLKWFNGTAGKDNASWYRFATDWQGSEPRFHGREISMNAPIEMKPAQLVTEFIQLRDAKKQFEELCAEKANELYVTRMNEIEGQLLELLNKLGVESIAGKGGIAYKKVSTSVTVADMREFRRHVIGTENWDLADWKANKTVVNEMVEAGGEIPPGVNRTSFISVGIRRK